jgi:hypothetical protein
MGEAMIGITNALTREALSRHHASAEPDVSVTTPPQGVTTVVPDGSTEPAVVASSSPGQTPDLPFDVDDDAQVLMGQQSGSPLPIAAAANAVERGDVGAMEFGDYGVLPDGTPAFAFTGENGQRQVLMLTSSQWLAGLEARGAARQETQFRVDAKRKREQHGRSFRAALAASGLPAFDQQVLNLMFEMSPDAAMGAARTAHTARQKMDYEQRQLGATEALGMDRSEWLKKFGIEPPPSMSQSDWDAYWKQIIANPMAATIPVMVHGEALPAIEAEVIARGYVESQINADKFRMRLGLELAEPEVAGAGGDLINRLQLDVDMLAPLTRTVSQINLPQSATVFDSWAGKRDANRTLRSLITAAVMSGEFGRPMSDLENDPENALADLMAAVNGIQSSVLGWAPLSDEQMAAMLPRLSAEADRWRSLHDDLRFRTQARENRRSQAAADAQAQRQAASAAAVVGAEQQRLQDRNNMLNATVGLPRYQRDAVMSLWESDPEAAKKLLVGYRSVQGPPGSNGYTSGGQDDASTTSAQWVGAVNQKHNSEADHLLQNPPPGLSDKLLDLNYEPSNGSPAFELAQQYDIVMTDARFAEFRNTPEFARWKAFAQVYNEALATGPQSPQ